MDLYNGSLVNNDNPETCLLREVAKDVGLDLTADTFQIANESQYIEHCKANLYFVTTTVKLDVKTLGCGLRGITVF